MPTLPLPFVVKAPREGSSVGVFIVKDAAKVADTMREAWLFGSELLVEEFVRPDPAAADPERTAATHPRAGTTCMDARRRSGDVDRVRRAGRQRAAHQGREDQPDRRHPVLREHHGRDRGHQQQEDDLGLREVVVRLATALHFTAGVIDLVPTPDRTLGAVLVPELYLSGDTDTVVVALPGRVIAVLLYKVLRDTKASSAARFARRRCSSDHP